MPILCVRLTPDEVKVLKRRKLERGSVTVSALVRETLGFAEREEVPLTDEFAEPLTSSSVVPMLVRIVATQDELVRRLSMLTPTDVKRRWAKDAAAHAPAPDPVVGGFSR